MRGGGLMGGQTVGPPSAQTSPLSNVSKNQMMCGCICGPLPSTGLFLADLGQEQPVKRRIRPRGWLRTGRHLVNIRASQTDRGRRTGGVERAAGPGWLFLPADAVPEAQPQVPEPDVYLPEAIGAQGLAGRAALVDHGGRRARKHPY